MAARKLLPLTPPPSSHPKYTLIKIPEYNTISSNWFLSIFADSQCFLQTASKAIPINPALILGTFGNLHKKCEKIGTETIFLEVSLINSLCLFHHVLTLKNRAGGLDKQEKSNDVGGKG
jgi:hypothetical protein